MKLIEADKVEQAIKDYWRAQVDRLPIPKSIEEHDAYANRLDAILEHNDGLLKAVDELPSVEPEAISKWKKEFREYVDSLDITRDDWKGIIEYIDELPSAEPDTTTHDSNVVKKGGNDEDGTSGDCISRQQAIDAVSNCGICIQRIVDLPSVQPERKTGQWILDRSGAYCCSKCMEPCATYVMMKPRDKFCKMCGSRNEVAE